MRTHVMPRESKGRSRRDARAGAEPPRLVNGDRARYAALKQMLQERAREIQDKLRFLRETLPAEAAEVKDPEEQSLNEFVQSVDFALIQMKSETLSQIDDAIRRLEEGAYGFCGDCGERIEKARLNALPFARLCRDCQEQEESRETVEAGRLVGSVPSLSERSEEAFVPSRALRRLATPLFQPGSFSWGFR